MTKIWSFANVTDILLKYWGQWLCLKITISTKSQMSIPFDQISYNFKTGVQDEFGIIYSFLFTYMG